jgi:mono/diheme cytochrome c family protein
MSWLMKAKGRVLLATVAVWAALDGVRSWYARVGYAAPTELWQPDPNLYSDLTWPPGADISDRAPAGQRVYAKHCAVCHGPNGRGNGPAAPSLIPRPRDLTLAEFKYKSTAAEAPPTELDLVRTVTQGLQASAMPSFVDILTQDEIRAVVQYIQRFSSAFAAAAEPLAIPSRIPSSRESVERGRAVYGKLGCEACHGKDGRLWKTFEDSKGYPVRSRDLTAPWTFRGGAAPEQLWLRITTGVGPMPSYEGASTPEERWDLVNYVTSMARIPPWEPGGKLEGPGQSSDKLARGDYLVHSEICGLCHTQINRTGIYRDESYLAGGMRVGMYPHGFYISRNLTSDPETGIGAWTEDQLIQAFTNGRSPDRTLNVDGMPWAVLHPLSPEDARGIAAYLKVLSPVKNQIPPPLRYGVLETIAVKLTLPLPAAFPKRLTYAEGNFGNRDGADRLPRLLTGLQALVLVLGLALLLFAGPPNKRVPRTVWGWILWALSALGLLLLGFVAWMLYELPAVSFIPPGQVAGAVAGGQPTPDESRLSVEQRALVRRGKYLFVVNSCLLCHGAKGGGGLKISWRPMGTLWTRNISSDRETGIGSWTDAQIARAIRSGVSRDGRPLHWQGMIWDHDSNLDEEDIRALVSYLRTLPPVRRAIPQPEAPSQADCEVYSFFPNLEKKARPGCTDGD